MQDPDRSEPRCHLHRFGSAEFDEAKVELRVAGLRVDVENRALGVLAYLLHHADEVVTKEELLREVWGPQAEDRTHYLRVYMAALRRKLKPDPAHPRHLITEPGLGYRFDP